MENIKMKSPKQTLYAILFGSVIMMSFTPTIFAQFPNPGVEIDGNTALVITDPQNDFLSPNGVTWGVVGESVTENNTVENIETGYPLANNGQTCFISANEARKYLQEIGFININIEKVTRSYNNQKHYLEYLSIVAEIPQ